MDPVITRQAPAKPDAGQANNSLSPDKNRPSKFDTIRDQTIQENQGNGAGLNTTNALSNQPEVLKLELRKKLNANPSRRPADVFGDDLKATGNSLNQLKSRVSALPPSSALDQIQKRLSDLDTQFQKAGASIETMNGSASPKQLLKLQMDMNNLSENLTIVSKMADQATSGIKSILQTQV